MLQKATTFPCSKAISKALGILQHILPLFVIHKTSSDGHVP